MHFTSQFFMTIDDIVGNDPQVLSVDILTLEQEDISQKVAEGGFLFEGGKEYGKPEKVEGAKQFKADYQKYLQSDEGKKLVQMYGDAPFDGYGLLDLGEKAVAAVIKTKDGKQYLTLNERYAGKLGDMDKLYVMAHEHMHGTGVDSEKGVEHSLKLYFNQLLKGVQSKMHSAKDWAATKGSYLKESIQNNYGKLADAYHQMGRTADYRMQMAPN